jgi:type I restriction enzyme S subunit
MNAARLLEYVHPIADTPDAIARLRSFMLDLAVRGKLVRQDEKDEAASELLKRIVDEHRPVPKRRRRSSGNINDGQPEEPFDLPRGWRWIRFGQIHDLVRGVTYSKSDASDVPTEGHLPILRANNIGTVLNFDELVFIKKSRISDEQVLRRGDYLIALSSGSKNLVGKAAFVANAYEGGFGAFCGVIRLYSSALEPFVGVYLASRLYRDAISAGSRGIGINNLKKETLSGLAFPLPPLAEQQRIVAKVDELIALCDKPSSTSPFAASSCRRTQRTRRRRSC